MPKNFAAHTTLLILSVAGVYFWLITPGLFPYTLQLVAVLVLIYAGVHWFRPAQHISRSTIPFDLTLLTSMMLLLLTETGALASPFFFVLYFLLFAVALLYEIEAVLILTGVLILFFLLLPGTDFTDLRSLSELSALLMVTPLAIFTGHQKEKLMREQAQLAALSRVIGREETDTLIFLSLNLKKTLLSALDSLSIMIPKTKIRETRVSLETLYQDLKSLYRSANDLEQIVGQDETKK